MDETEVRAYVKAAAAVLAVPLDEARCARVAAHLARTAAMARLLEEAGLDVHDEPDEIYRPAPFPDAPSGVLSGIPSGALPDALAGVSPGTASSAAAGVTPGILPDAFPESGAAAALHPGPEPA